MARQPVRLHIGDTAVEGEEDQARVLLREMEKFRAARLPKLIELGLFDEPRRDQKRPATDGDHPPLASPGWKPIEGWKRRT